MIQHGTAADRRADIRDADGVLEVQVALHCHLEDKEDAEHLVAYALLAFLHFPREYIA
jgi:hypothetical protein